MLLHRSLSLRDISRYFASSTQQAEVETEPGFSSSWLQQQMQAARRLPDFYARHRLLVRALLLTLVWEVVAQIIGYLAASTLPPSKDVGAFLLDHPAFQHKNYPLFETMWARWDGIWYTLIATQGYDLHISILNAFFPAFPGLIHLVGGVLGDNYLLAGILINRLLLFPTVGIFTQIVREESGDDAAESAPLFFLLVPAAVFFLAVYTETLFLLACLACFLAMRHQRWWLAGACCAVATATRLPGIILMGAMIVEGVASHKPWQALGAAALSLSGIAAYALYLAARYGDPLAFQHAYNYGWGGRHFSLNIFAAPFLDIQWLVQHWPWQGASAFFTASYVLALVVDSALLLLMWPSLRWSYRVFVAGNMLLPLLSATLFAYNRYSLVLFPFLLVACRWTAKRSTLRGAALLTMGCFSVLNIIFFTASYWVG
jgi:Gpi18-like mannosyltransferase